MSLAGSAPREGDAGVDERPEAAQHGGQTMKQLTRSITKRSTRTRSKMLSK